MDSYIYIIDDLAFFLTGILFLYFLCYPPLHISDISHTLKLKKISLRHPYSWKQSPSRFIWERITLRIHHIQRSISRYHQFRQRTLRLGSYPAWYCPYSVPTTVGQDLWRLWCRNTGNPATYTRKRLQGISFQISSDAWWNKKQPAQGRQYAIRVIIQFAWNQYGYWSGMVTEKPEKVPKPISNGSYFDRTYISTICRKPLFTANPIRPLLIGNAPKNDLLFAPLSIRRELGFLNRIMQLLIPSPLKLCIFVGIYALLMTAYNWTSSLGWWSILFGFIHCIQSGDSGLSGRRQKKEKTLNMEKKNT